MEKNSALKQFITKHKIGESLFLRLFSSAAAADKSVRHDLISQVIVSDDTYLTEIESALFSLERIVKNPQRFIIEQAEVVQIEKAKKITSRSVRHLSANTNLIREVDSEGNVIPAKILSSFMEEDLFIHENRFVYTLILRLLKFLEMRKEYSQKNLGTFDSENLSLSANLDFGSANIEYALDVKVKTLAEKQKGANKKSHFLKRLEDVHKRVRALRGSDFFRKLSKTSPLNPPIAKTNLLTKHKDYAACYRLWLYLYSVTTVGVSADISHISINADDGYYDDITFAVVSALKVVLDRAKALDGATTQELPASAYKFLVDFEYKPDFTPDMAGAEDDYINEYYLKKIKEIVRDQNDPLAIAHAAEKSDGTITHIHNLSMPFTRFYRKIASINNQLYREYLHYGLDTDRVEEDKDSLRKKIADNKELLRRHQMLCRLKEIELDETRRAAINISGSINLLEHKLKTFKDED